MQRQKLCSGSPVTKADWHDVYPKPDLDGNFLGDGYPLCSDLPAGTFLAPGAVDKTCTNKDWFLKGSILGTLFGKDAGGQYHYFCHLLQHFLQSALALAKIVPVLRHKFRGVSWKDTVIWVIRPFVFGVPFTLHLLQALSSSSWGTSIRALTQQPQRQR